MDGKSSRRMNARLEISNHDIDKVSLYFENEEGKTQSLNFTHRQIVIHSRLGNTPREISLPDGQLFLTEDHAQIDAFQKSKKQSRLPRILHFIESHIIAVGLATILTALAIWVLIVYGIPKSTEIIAYQMPEQTAQEFGSTLNILDKTLFDPTELDEKEQQRVREIVAPYLEKYKALNPKIEFRSGMKVNAFALPSGHIVFTDDLVKLFKKDEEILTVFFHELGHLEHRHLLRRALQDSFITLLVIFVTGDIDSFDLLTGIPTLLVDLSYSRLFELEADRYALSQMQKANISLEHFATVMSGIEAYYEKLEQEEEAENKKAPDTENKKDNYKVGGLDFKSYLSTHPYSKERILLIEEYQQKGSSAPAP